MARDFRTSVRSTWVSVLALSFVLCIAASPTVDAQTASVNLGTTDAVSGLSNAYRGNGTDGENDALNCGPAADVRSSRRPRGTTDNDLADHFLYLTVTNATVKAASSLTIRATFFDEAARAGDVLTLEYSTSRAAGGSFREVFFSHPYEHSVGGSGVWVTREWIVRDAGFASRQQAQADFRISSRVPGGAFTRLCYDRIEVTVGAPAALACPSNLTAAVDSNAGTITLAWTNATPYDRIEVLRNGFRLASLAGNAVGLADRPPPARYRYQVVALKAGEGCWTPRLAVEARLFPQLHRCGCPYPDLNRDGAVDLQDVAIAASNLNLPPADPRFSIEGDANHDGLVDLSDVQLVLAHLRSPPPYPTLELRLEPHGAVGSVAEPGAMTLIQSPYARGSGRLEEVADSLLRHGRLLVTSGSGAGEQILELDPDTGAQSVFSNTSRADATGDRGVSGVVALAFEGPAVAVANAGAADAFSPVPVGSVARLDPRTGNPLTGPPVNGGATTGVFVGDQDAIDDQIGPQTADRPAGGYLSETAGIAEGGAGIDGTEASPRNRVLFQSNWEADLRGRRASITAADLDSGLCEVATAADGIAGPLVYVPNETAFPTSLPSPVVIRLDAAEGTIANVSLPPPDDNAGIVLQGAELSFADAGMEDSVVFNILASEAPSPGEYAVRLRARLAMDFLYSKLRFEVTLGDAAATLVGEPLERRMRSGVLPGKLGQSAVMLPVGRIELRGGVSQRLVVTAVEPGVVVERIELEGPVGSRVYAAMRDPGSIHVFGLTRGATPGGQPILRGVLERIVGVCEIEGNRSTEPVIDPIELDLVSIAGEQKLLLADSLRRTINVFSLDGDFERCIEVPLAGSYLTGLALGTSGPDALPTLFLGARTAAGGGGGAEDPGLEFGDGGGAAPSSGVLSVLDIEEIFFDRSASGIVEPLWIQDRRSLVLLARFADGGVRDVTSLAEYTNLHPEVVELLPVSTVRARRSAGYADIQAELQGLVAETRVLVSASEKPFRVHRPVAFNASPPLGATLQVFPNPASLAEVFGTEPTLLRFPVGYRQQFSAVEFDASGRAAAAGGTQWSASTAAGNTIDAGGVFSANQSENASELGVDAGGTGLAVRARVSAERGDLASASVSVAVYQPVDIPKSPLRAIRLLPRDLRLLPGSEVQFVAALVDENGILRNIEPPAGVEDPTYPGAVWSSDGLPIDERTGLFRALYAAETVDETCTITVHDPSTGLSDSTSVTVLYSETNGVGTYRDAQLERLGEESLTVELQKLILAVHAKRLHDIKVDRESSNVAAQLFHGDFEEFFDSLDSVFFDFGSGFELDFLSEMLFELEGAPELSVVEVNPGQGKRYLEVRLQLHLADLLDAHMKDFSLELKFNTLPSFLLDLCNLVSKEICDEQVCKQALGMKKKAGEKPILKDQVTNDFDEFLGSRLRYVAHLDLATGRFDSTYSSASWRTLKDEDVSRYLSRLFVNASNLRPQLKVLRDAVLLILLGEDESRPSCQLNLKKYIFKPVAEWVCDAVINLLAAVGINVAGIRSGCIETLTNLMEKGLKAGVDAVFNGIDDNIEEWLQDIIEAQLVRRLEEHVYDTLRDAGLLSETELGYAALAGIGDQGRVASLRFGGSPLPDPSLALHNAPLGSFAGTSLYFDQDLVAFTHDLTFSYGAFPAHAALGARGRVEASVTSANPLEPVNGTGRGNVGVAAQADDVVTNLLRYSGSTAFQLAGTRRGSVALGTASASGGGDSVVLTASTRGAPRLVFSEAAPGELRGRVEELAIVEATGSLTYTVSAVASVGLTITRNGQQVTVDVPGGAPALAAPADGEVPFAAAIRALVASSIPDLRAFLLGPLGVKLPVTIDYPTIVGERPGLGHFSVELRGADTDEALEDDVVQATFVETIGAGGLAEGEVAPEAQEQFRRGDCNDDGRIDVSDALSVIRSLRQGSPDLGCRAACDFNGSGVIEWADPVYLLRWLTSAGPPPAAPFAACGSTTGADECEGGHHACP